MQPIPIDLHEWTTRAGNSFHFLAFAPLVFARLARWAAAPLTRPAFETFGLQRFALLRRSRSGFFFTVFAAFALRPRDFWTAPMAFRLVLPFALGLAVAGAFLAGASDGLIGCSASRFSSSFFTFPRWLGLAKKTKSRWALLVLRNGNLLSLFNSAWVQALRQLRERH
ncbi:MAG: hypothetical protein ABSA12_16330 [Verrucomicrobiia bacterium]|jgi:hypothetical protein